MRKNENYFTTADKSIILKNISLKVHIREYLWIVIRLSKRGNDSRNGMTKLAKIEITFQVLIKTKKCVLWNSANKDINGKIDSNDFIKQENIKIKADKSNE